MEEQLGKEPPKTKKELQSILGSLNQLTAWIPQVKCKIPLMRKLSGANNKFETSKQLEDEFNTMKRHMKRQLYCCLWKLEETFISIQMHPARDLGSFSLTP